MKTIISTKNLQNNTTIINDVVNNDGLIADKLNSFLSIGNSLSNKIKKKWNPLSYIKSTVNSIPDFVESDILAMISYLKNSSSVSKVQYL